MDLMEEMIESIEPEQDLDLPSCQKLDKEMEVLERIDDLSHKELSSVENSRIKSPITSVEESLAQFVRDTFEVTKKDFEFNQSLQEELCRRLPEMSNSELITLHSNSNVNNNDKVSKIINPTFGMITTKQQAEITAAKQQEREANVVVNTGMQTMAALNNDASKDVLQGMYALTNILQSIVKENKNEEEK